LVAARAPGQDVHAERAPQGDHAGAVGAGADHPEGLAQHLRENARRQGPAPPRISRSMRGILRPVVSISAIACSATAKALTPGVLHTVMPRRPAAPRSMLSVPVPHTDTSFSSRQAAKTPSLKRA